MSSVVTFTFPLAAIVIVLFLLWNDLLRRRRTFRFLLFARSALCLALAAVLVFNWRAFSQRYEDLPLIFIIMAVSICAAASVWFFYRGLRGDASFVAPEEEPLPKIFDSSRHDGNRSSSSDGSAPDQ